MLHRGQIERVDVSDYSVQSDISDEYEITASDLEPASEDQDWKLKDYWFGKMYFRCMMAEQLLKRSHPEETVSELDARLEASVREFPYREVAKLFEDQVSDRLWRDCEDEYEGFVTCIGAVRRKGISDEKKLIKNSLGRSGGEQNWPGIAYTAAKSGEGKRPAKPVLESPVVASSKHKTTLKEYGDKQQTRPQYTAETIYTNPVTFRSILVYRTMRFEAVGKSKKEAENAAAKKACDKFGIEV